MQHVVIHRPGEQLASGIIVFFVRLLIWGCVLSVLAAVLAVVFLLLSPYIFLAHIRWSEMAEPGRHRRGR
jgi:hypothetical protein